MLEKYRELTAADQIESKRLAVHLGFPPEIDVRRIGLYQKKIESMLGLGAISHLGVNSDYVLSIIDRDESEVGAHKGQLFSGQKYQHDNTQSFHALNWMSIGMTLHWENIIREMDYAEQDHMVAENWIPYIDAGIKTAITQGSKMQLLRTNAAEISTAGLLNSLNITVLVDAFSNREISYLVNLLGSIPETAAFNVLMWGGFEFIRKKIFKNWDGKDDGYRYSVIPGFEIDRFALVQLLLHMGPLVVPLQPQLE